MRAIVESVEFRMVCAFWLGMLSTMWIFLRDDKPLEDEHEDEDGYLQTVAASGTIAPDEANACDQVPDIVIRKSRKPKTVAQASPPAPHFEATADS